MRSQRALSFVFFLALVLALVAGSAPLRPAHAGPTAPGVLLYWTETKSGKIMRGNANGDGVPATLIPGQVNPRGLVVSDSRGKIYWIERDAGRIRAANLDGSSIQTLVSGLSSPDRMALDEDTGRLYFTENGDSDRIRRINVDGSDLQTVLSGLSGPTGIAIDSVNNYLYWTEFDTDSIWRSSIDFGGQERVLQLAGGARPLEIVIDPVESRMYWASGNQGAIYSADLEGNGAGVWEYLGSPRALAIDVEARKLYWADHVTKLIQRANLDATNIENLYSAGADGLDAPLGLAVSAGSNTTCYPLARTITGEGGLPVPSPSASAGCASGQYKPGQSISLTASPAPDWRVAGWSGTDSDGSTSVVNTVTMPAANHTVRVIYERVPDCHLLKLDHKGLGADPAASPAQSAGCSPGYYTVDQTIVLTASPWQGWQVAGWTGTVYDVSKDLTNFVLMPDGEHEAVARYQEEPLDLKRSFIPQIVSQLPSGPTCYTGENEIEPNNPPQGQPTGPLCSGEDYYGHPNDANDYFTFQTTGGSIEIEVRDHKGGGVQLLLYYATLKSNPIFIDNDPANGLFVSLQDQPAGLYYIRIYTATPNPNEMQKYRLTVRFQ